MCLSGSRDVCLSPLAPFDGPCPGLSGDYCLSRGRSSWPLKGHTPPSEGHVESGRGRDPGFRVWTVMESD